MFELKYFFTASINAADGGEAHSPEAVRHQIKGLIDEETKLISLSDDRIVEILREKASTSLAARSRSYREKPAHPVERRTQTEAGARALAPRTHLAAAKHPRLQNRARAGAALC